MESKFYRKKPAFNLKEIPIALVVMVGFKSRTLTDSASFMKMKLQEGRRWN